MADVKLFNLQEGRQDYVRMFSDFVAADIKNQALVNKYVDWASNTLKKNDRIVWFLRWVRIELAGRVKYSDSDSELAKINKRLRQSYTSNDLIPISNLMTNLQHFLSLPIPQNQQLLWQTQSPRGLLNEFKEIEDEWKRTLSANNIISYQKGKEPKIVIKFPDGYAWFDLEKPFCRQEADAMGHCGNAATKQGDKTILSLRKLVAKTNEESFWHPVLTFILDKNGVLGEMKGRNNDKPVAKYHPYIVALLKRRLIRGIKGGGYLPEHNFKLSDLSEPEREALLAKKPELGDVADLYDKEGMTKRVLALVQNGLADKGLEFYSREGDKFVVQQWKNFDSYISDVESYRSDIKNILEIAQGEAYFQTDRTNVTSDYIKVVVSLPEHWQDRLVQRAMLTRSPGETPDDLLRRAAETLIQKKDDWYWKFHDLYNLTPIVEQAWERLQQYADAGWAYGCNEAWDNIPRGEEFRTFAESNQPVLLYVSERDIIRFAAGDTDDDEEIQWSLSAMRDDSYGNPSWEFINEENTRENRRENHLIDRSGNDTWLKTIDQSTAGDLVALYVELLSGANPSMRIDDPRQQSLKLESMRYLMNLCQV